MCKNRNAVPAAATAKNGDGQFHFEGFGMTLSDSDHITASRKPQVQIERFLLRGADNALSVRVLSEMTGLVPRGVTAAIQDARRRGIPVISTTRPGGFFLASNEAERQRCLRSLEHRKAEIAWTAWCLENAKLTEVGNGN